LDLEEADECYYLGEYTARKGYAHSPTNSLILNLKKDPILRETPQWFYKGRAIAQAGRHLRLAFNEEWLQRATLIPIPPSKIRGHESYDDRMLNVLRFVGRGSNFDIRELVLQRESTDADHECEYRRPSAEIAANYYIDELVREPAPQVFGVFDDVLTKGSHFKAMQLILNENFPDVPVTGIFIARRVPQPDEDLFDGLF